MNAPGPAIDLSGRTALVTGAGRGIGRAISQVLADCGARVLGVASPAGTAALGPLGDEIAAAGGTFAPLACDLSDRAALAGLVAEVARDHGPVDILVNNAGIIRRAPAAEHATEDWDAVMAVNLDAVFVLTRDIGRTMVERGAGKVVNVASVLSYQGGILVPGYAAAKGAVVQLTRAFANEWAGQGVNVNAVAPGYVATDNTAALRADPDRDAALMARVPAGRWATPEDIAWPVAFLASDLAGFVHGTVLAVDGGWLGR